MTLPINAPSPAPTNPSARKLNPMTTSHAIASINIMNIGEPPRAVTTRFTTQLSDTV